MDPPLTFLIDVLEKNVITKIKGDDVKFFIAYQYCIQGVPQIRNKKVINFKIKYPVYFVTF